jgi:hypothetical protein
MILRRILILIFFLPTASFASGFQVGYGSITPHFTGPGFKNYCNQIGHSNVILNPTYYVRAEGQRDAFTAMMGKDSICSNIEGLFYSYKFLETKWVTMALMVGGYHFYMNHWKDEVDNTPKDRKPVTPVYTKIGNFYFVPMGAFEFDLALFHSGSWSLNFNSIFTPIIFNHSLSLKKTF